jgi:hypothetical protein
MKCPFKIPVPLIPWPHIAFYCLSALTVTLAVIGLPLPFLINQVQCITPWGYKINCDIADYTRKVDNLGDIGCQLIETRLEVITAFFLMGIFFETAAGVLFLLGYFFLHSAKLRWCIFTFAFATSACFIISWALEAGTFVTDVCREGNGSYKDRNWLLTSGFAILVAAWSVSVATTILVACYDPKFQEYSAKVEEVA